MFDERVHGGHGPAMDEVEVFLAEVERRAHGAALWELDHAETQDGGDAAQAVCSSLFKFADDIAERLRDQTDDDEQPACARGCYFCCYAPVTITPIEAEFVATHLKSTLKPEGLRVLQQALDEHANAIVGIDIPQRFMRGLACPLLDRATGQCTVYAVRPLRCRGANSLSKERCEAATKTPDAEVNVKALIFDTYAQMTRGLVRALDERGMVSRASALSGLVAAALAQSPGLTLESNAGERQ